jgi:ABC-type glycerol-3-phosphate transport system substrate-binding protein
MKIKMRFMTGIMLMLMFMLAGCGGPKPDVTIFAMGPSGFPAEIGSKLEASLKAKLGEAPTVKIVTTPIFSLEKMVVEIAGAGNGILILPEEQFKALADQAGFVALDDVIKPEDYPEGVLEMPEKDKPGEKHLYGIPLAGNKWMKELGFDGKGLVAFVPQNAKKIEEAKNVLKVIAEK